MMLPIEPTGSIPRPLQLIETIEQCGGDEPGFYIALVGERDRARALKIVKRYTKPEQCVFIDVVAAIDPRVETSEEIRDRPLEAVAYLSVEQFGTTDNCGFSASCGGRSTSRATAFARIRTCVAGTAPASEILGVSE